MNIEQNEEFFMINNKFLDRYSEEELCDFKDTLNELLNSINKLL